MLAMIVSCFTKIILDDLRRCARVSFTNAKVNNNNKDITRTTIFICLFIINLSSSDSSEERINNRCYIQK